MQVTMNVVIASFFLVSSTIPHAKAAKKVRDLFEEYTQAFFRYRGFTLKQAKPSLGLKSFEKRRFIDAHNKAQDDTVGTLWMKLLAVKKQDGWPTSYCTGAVRLDTFDTTKVFNEFYHITSGGAIGKEAGFAPGRTLEKVEKSKLVFPTGGMATVVEFAKEEAAKTLKCTTANIIAAKPQGFQLPTFDFNGRALEKQTQYLYFIMTKAV